MLHFFAHYSYWYQYHLKFVISALCSSYTAYVLVSSDLSQYWSGFVLLLLLVAIVAALFYLVHLRDHNEHFNNLYYSRRSAMYYQQPKQPRSLKFMLSGNEPGKLMEVRRYSDLETQALHFMSENHISKAMMDRCMDLVFLYIRDQIIKKSIT